MRRERLGVGGFSLLEGLFSLFLILLVLSGLSTTLNQANAVKKNTREMDQAIEEFHALFSMKNEIMAALAVSSPGPSSSSNRLELSRVNPRLNYRDRRDPLGPFEPDEQIEVTYQMVDNILRRVEKEPGEPATSERLIPIESLEFQRSGGRSPIFTVTFAVKRSRRKDKIRSLKVSVNAL